MSDLERLISKLKVNGEQNGYYINNSCQPSKIERVLRDGKFILQTEVPNDYIELLMLTDGIGTQRGNIYSASDFIEQNDALWLCETTLEKTQTGIAIQYNEKQNKEIPTYAYLGNYGNLDRYIYNFATQKYDAINFYGDETEIWSSHTSLVDLLLYMTGEQNVV